MDTKINPLRLLSVLVVCLLLLGTVALAVTGQLLHLFASAGGYLHANIDLMFGKRELQVNAHRIGPRLRLASRVSGLGLPTTEKYYICLSRTPCASYRRAYDVQVRKEINHKFGYDVIAEAESRRSTYMSVTIQHR